MIAWFAGVMAQKLRSFLDAYSPKPLMIEGKKTMTDCTKYEDIRSSLKSGDIVLMGGVRPFSRVIRFMTRSQFSHVAMVLKVADLDMLLLWESTTEGHGEDFQTGKCKRGVQLTPLSKRIAEHEGNLVIRRLSRSLTTAEMAEIRKFRHSVRDRGFDFDALELFKASVDIGLGWFRFTENREDLSSLFCSELIAETYQRAGLLGESKPSNEYTPSDFFKMQYLCNSAALGDPIWIKRENAK